MKKSAIFLLMFLIIGTSLFAAGGQENAKGGTVFPAKPVKVVVYLAPGGAGDILARKFTDVASRHTNATFVVENKPGAGGIVALEYVKSLPADGYNLMYVTKSIVSQIASTGSDIDLNKEYEWIGCLQFDPQCVIVNEKTGLVTWKQIYDDAKAKKGAQLWLGPAAGGFDHMTAQAIWKAANMQAKWVPFDSGAGAIAALIGKQGVLYVGNPSETRGKPDLGVAAICYTRRLASFPDVPTFEELGVHGVENEVMWRGFAVKKGTPENVIKWYEELFEKVTNDQDWRNTYEKDGIDVVNWKKDKFNKLIADDLAAAKALEGKK